MKKVILSPISSGKSYFMEKNNFHYNGYDLYCGEWLSTKNNIIDGINMGGESVFMPPTHKLYKEWCDLYKLGLDEFKNIQSNNSVLIFNGLEVLDIIINEYPEFEISLVLPEYSIHESFWLKKLDSFPSLKKPAIEIIKDVEIYTLRPISKIFNWAYIKEERSEYKKISELKNIKLYTTFNEAIQ